MNAWKRPAHFIPRSFGLSLALSIIFYMGCAGSYAGESVKELFDLVPASRLRGLGQSEESDATVVRSRFALVNSDDLAGERVRRGADRIVLNMFEDFSPTAVKERVEWRSKDDYTWFGRIAGEERSQVILVFKEGDMAGNITIRGEMYQIRAVEDGIHAIREIDQSGFPEELEPIPVN